MENQTNFFNARGGAARRGSIFYNIRGLGRGFTTSARPSFLNSLPEKGKYTPRGFTYSNNRPSWNQSTGIRPNSSRIGDSQVETRSGNTFERTLPPALNTSTYTTNRFNKDGYNKNQITSNTGFGGFNQQGYNRNQTSGFHNKNQENVGIDKEPTFRKEFEPNPSRKYPPSSGSFNKSESLQKPFLDNTTNKQSSYKFDSKQKYGSPSTNRSHHGFSLSVQPESEVIEIEDEPYAPACNKNTFGREPLGSGFKEQPFSRESNKSSSSGFISGNKKDFVADRSTNFKQNLPANSQRFTPSNETNSLKPSLDRRFCENNSYNRGGFNNRSDSFNLEFSRDDLPERRDNREERFDKGTDLWKDRGGSNYSYNKYEPPEGRNNQSEERFHLNRDYQDDERYIKNNEQFYPANENYSQKEKYDSGQRFEPPDDSLFKRNLTEGKHNRDHSLDERIYPSGGVNNSFSRYEPPDSRYKRNDSSQERLNTNRSFNSSHHMERRFDRDEQYNRTYTEKERFQRDKSFNVEDLNFNRNDSFNRDNTQEGRFERDSFNRDHPKEVRFNRGNSFHRDQSEGGGFYRDNYNREQHEGERFKRDSSEKRKFNPDDSFEQGRFNKQYNNAEESFKKSYREDSFSRDNRAYREHSPKRRFNKEIPFKRGRSPEERYDRNTFEHHQVKYSPPSPQAIFDPPQGKFSPPDYVNSWNAEVEPHWSPPKKRRIIMNQQPATIKNKQPAIIKNKQPPVIKKQPGIIKKNKQIDIINKQTKNIKTQKPVKPNPTLGWSTKPSNFKEPFSKRQFKRSIKVKQATLNLRLAYNPRLIPPNPETELKMKNLFQRIKIMPIKAEDLPVVVTDSWINCAVIHKCYPLKVLTIKKIVLLKRMLKVRARRAKEVPHPKFVYNYQKRSYLNISCANEATKKWLENTIKDYVTTSNVVPLKVLESKDLMRRVSLEIPGNEIPTTEEFLRKLSEENSLDVSSWKVVRKYENNPLEFFIYMTAPDYKNIENLNNKVLYGSKEVVVTLI